MRNPLNEAITEWVNNALSTQESVDPHTAADQFVSDEYDLIQENLAQLIRKQLIAEFKARAKQTPEDSGQLALFPGLPAAFAVGPHDYRPRNRATWEDIMTVVKQRAENKAHVDKAFDRLMTDVDRLRPYMEDHPERTIEEATALLVADEDAAAEDNE